MDAVGDVARPARVGLDDRERADRALGLLAPVALEAVRAEQRALDEGLRALARGQPVAQDLGRERARPEVAGAPRARGRRPAQHLGGRLRARAEPGDHDAAAVRVQVRHLPGLRLELLGLEHAPHLPAARAVEPREPVGKLLLVGVEPREDRVGDDLVQPLARDGDLHAVSPPSRLWARRIMSTSPSVTSSSPTHPTSTQRTSSASLPATASTVSGRTR